MVFGSKDNVMFGGGITGSGVATNMTGSGV